MSDTRDLYIRAHADDKELTALYEKLRAIGGQSKITAADLTTYEQAVKAGAISTREMTAAQEAAARNEKRAADEMQRYGQMVARAEAEDRRRTAAINAQTEALNRKAAAEERAVRSQNLSGVRGAAGIGQLAGVLPGGTGAAVTGVSSLLNAGLSSTTALAGGAALAIGVLSFGVVKLANSLGTYAREQENLSQRTGFSTTQTQLFGRAAGLVDVNAGTLTATMRTLSKALSDNSEEGKKAKGALAELGIGAVDQLSPMGELLPLIARRLGGMADGAEKDRIAIALLGRSGLELLPLLNDFDKLTAAVTASGVVIDRDGILKAEAYQRQVKLLGLEWDSVVNKFKQAAVATVSFAIDNKGIGGKIIDILTGVPSEALAGLSQDALRVLAVSDQARRNVAVELPEIKNAVVGEGKNKKDPSQSRLDQRESDILGYRNEFATPKEKIDERIKSLREVRDLAESAYRGVASGTPGKPGSPDKDAPLGASPEKDAAGAAVRDANRQLAAAERQRDALKDTKRANEELIRLQGKRDELQAKELFGEEKINAEYEAEIANLIRKKELNPATRAVAEQIRGIHLADNSRANAVAAIENTRKDQDAGLGISQGLVRSQVARQAKLDQERLGLAGDEAGGINKAAQDRIDAAKTEVELAKQKAAIDRQRIAEEFAARPDTLKRDAALAETNRTLAQASGKGSDEIANARAQQQAELANLQKKNEHDREQASEEEIKRQRVLSDLEFQRVRTQSEGQSRLAVINAAPGFGLQAELNADAEKLRLDKQQAALDASRSRDDVARKTSELGNPGADRKTLEKEIADIELEAKKEAAKIEDDSIKARIDGEARIAEQRKQDEQAFRSTVTGFLSAARQGKGQDYLKGVGTKLLDTVTGNAAGLAFPTVDKLVGGISQTVSGTQDSPTPFGRLLAGTGLGPRAVNPQGGGTGTVTASQTSTFSKIFGTGASGKDNPQNVSVAANTTATDLNTAALNALTATQTAIVTGQPLPNGSTPTGTGGSIAGIPGLRTFGSDTNGITGNGSLVGNDIYGNAIPNPNLANQDVVRSLGLSSSGATAAAGTTGLSGVLGGLGHTGDLRAVFTGTTSGGQDLTGAQQAGAAIGTAGVVYAGATAAIKDFSKGGARGVVGGIGDVAGTALTFDKDPTGISQAVLSGVALGAKVISALLGDPRQNRQNQIDKELSTNVFQAPVAQNRTQDIFGNYTDFDRFGKVQESNFSAVPQTTAPYIVKRNANGVGTYYDVPGSTTSPFTPTVNPSSAAPPANVYVSMNSLDPKSGMDYFHANPDVANAVVHAGLSMATGPAQATVRRVAGVGG